MKIRPVAKTHTIRGLLQERLDKYNDALGMTNTRLEELSKPGSIIKLNNDSEREELLYERANLEADIQDTNDKLTVIDSHQAPAIAVEFNL